MYLFTFGRFHNHFDPILQYGHRESPGRIARKPQPELRMRVGRNDNLGANPFELFHPRCGNMAVLQNNPEALAQAFFNVGFGDDPLTWKGRSYDVSVNHCIVVHNDVLM